jgi:hypothetical protein
MQRGSSHVFSLIGVPPILHFPASRMKQFVDGHDARRDALLVMMFDECFEDMRFAAS